MQYCLITGYFFNSGSCVRSLETSSLQIYFQPACYRHSWIPFPTSSAVRVFSDSSFLHIFLAIKRAHEEPRQLNRFLKFVQQTGILCYIVPFFFLVECFSIAWHPTASVSSHFDRIGSLDLWWVLIHLDLAWRWKHKCRDVCRSC